MTEKNNREVRASYPRRYRAQFGENLKKKLKERRISQATLAKEIGVSRTCVGFWCNGHTIPCKPKKAKKKIHLRNPLVITEEVPEEETVDEDIEETSEEK